MTTISAQPTYPIARILPHRRPFLFITEVVRYEPGSLSASAQLSRDNAIARAHFPGNSVVPGAVLVEMIAQAGAALVRLTLANGKLTDNPPKPGFLAKINNMRFMHPARPGDSLMITVTETAHFGRAFEIAGDIVFGTTAIAQGSVLLLSSDDSGG